ncbi:MAG: M56 family metallopeptidase [Candidatus Krumholzibacteria bacterium]|nr:M56 family metallopeptidase [Candidatus Krumholzibacteria bacterium]
MNALYGFWQGMMAHLWQTTVVLALVFIIEGTLHRAPSRASHALWSVALAKIFMPLSLFGGIANSLYGAASGASAPGGRAAIPTIEPVVAVLFPMPEAGAPVVGSIVSYVVVAATTCWAAFALYFLARTVVDVVRARRHGGVPLASCGARGKERLERIIGEAEVPGESVLVSGRFVMPTVTGLFRPRIVMPEYLVNELPEVELRAILLHENTHRRRRDPLRAVAGRVGLSLFFFYPLIYPVLHRLRATAEFACDESVVHSGISADAYSRALARTLKLGLASPAFATAAAIAGSSLLRRRLDRLATLNPRRYAMRLQHRVLIVLAALLVAAATFYPVPMQAGPDQKKDTAKKETARQEPARKQVTAKVEVEHMVAPAYPPELRKDGYTSNLILLVKIDEKGLVMSAMADSIKIYTDQGEPIGKIDPDAGKRVAAIFEKSAIDAAKQWTFKVLSTGGTADTVEVKIPIHFKLQ